MTELKSLFNEEAPTPVTMGDATLKDGTKIKWEGDLAEGTAILVESPDGDIAAPDATHELEDGTLVTTVNGLVTAIVPVETVIVEEMDTELKAELTELKSVVAELATTVQSFTTQLEAKDSEIAKLKEAFKSTVQLVEQVANLPQEDATELPKGEDKNKFDKQLERIKMLKSAINKTVK